MIRWFVVFFLSLGIAMGGAQAQNAQDLPGAEDPLPEIRDHGQVLTWQTVSEDPQTFSVPMGALTGLAQINDWVHAVGPVSRTYYVREGAARRVEVVFRRQREVLERHGFEIRAAGFTNDRIGSGVGSRRWLDAYLGTNALPEGAPRGPGATAEAQGVVVASREQSEGTLWAVVSVYQPDAENIGMMVDVVQTSRAAPPPPIGSAVLTHQMETYGRAVLDGIAFLEDGTLDPSSANVLHTVGRFLGENTRQTYRIVGHTDDTHSLADAERLSQTQAESVVSALVSNEGADRERLRAFGVGPLAPLFPNDTAAGRTRNNRVELVAGP